MIFSTPPMESIDEAVLDLIERQKERLRLYTQHNPRRWTGSLRRSTFARAIQGSNTIEGYHATLDQALAVVAEETGDERTETLIAIEGYRNAMTYIVQASRDPYFKLTRQFLKSLHFAMLGHDMAKYPGLWRPGAVFVTSAATGQIVYKAPEADLVNELVEELIAHLKLPTTEPAIIRAAMAHLNLAMIHPFKDGSGRMARALQTFVLAQGGVLHPVFSSIEEWLGRNTEAYYQVLAEVGQGSWNPSSDARAWARFCLKAHHQQAATLIRRDEEYERVFEGISRIIERERLPERVAMTLFDAALGFRITNQRHRKDSEVSEMVASRDLKRLSDLGLLKSFGEKRGRFYRAGAELLALRQATRLARPLEDPFEIIRRKAAESGEAMAPRLPGY